MIILYVLIVWFQNQRWACHIAGCCEENTDEPSQKKVMTEQEKWNANESLLGSGIATTSPRVLFRSMLVFCFVCGRGGCLSIQYFNGRRHH